MKKTILALTVLCFIGCKKDDTPTPDPTPTPTPTPTTITLTGNILFQKIYFGVAPESSDIFILNPTNGAETQLTNFSSNGTLPKYTSDASWNTGKSKIVFASTKDNSSMEIYTINPNATSLTRLTNNLFIDYSPKFSPDGTKIAFIRYVTPVGSASVPTELFIINNDGTNEIKLTNVSLGGTLSKHVDGLYWNGNSEIYFTSDKDFSRRDIYKVNVTSQLVTRITTNIGMSQDFEVSPDGTFFVYSRTTIPFTFETDEIYKIKSDGTGETRLTTFSSNGTINKDSFRPSWTADSNILFMSTKDGFEDIYAMKSDGTGIIRVTTNANATRIYDQPRIR